jgi:hypothetical protein
MGAFVRHLIRATLMTAACGAVLGSPSTALAASHWVRATATRGGITEQVSAVRTADGVLHVVWAPAGQPGDLLATTISPSGSVGGSTTIASGWAGIGNPAIAAGRSGVLAVVAGAQHSTDTTDPIQNQALWTSPNGGGTWSLYPTDIAFGSGAADPVSLAFGADGVTPFTVWATSAGVFVHRGTVPAVPNSNLQQSAGWNCCGYDPGIAFDQAQNQLVVAWYSNATGHQGLYGQSIDPASGSPLGSPLLLPDSSPQQPGERTQIVSRSQGGLYLADAGGASGTRALVWRFGASRATTVGKSSTAVADVGVAADPAGRIWAFWATRNGGSTLLHAVRSNKSVTRWGAEVRLHAPRNETDAWKLDGNAQSGKLDLLGLFTVNGSVETWDAQVLPGLTIKAKARRGGILKITVTDAGQAVPGAVVRAAGHRARTNHSGVARLTLGGRRSRSITVRASKRGYTASSARIRLAR